MDLKANLEEQERLARTIIDDYDSWDCENDPSPVDIDDAARLAELVIARKEFLATVKEEEKFYTVVDLGDFSDTPGGRSAERSLYSAEEFYNSHVKPALNNFDIVMVNLDGSQGVLYSFLEEVFGGAVRDIGKEVYNRLIPYASKHPSRADFALTCLREAYDLKVAEEVANDRAKLQ